MLHIRLFGGTGVLGEGRVLGPGDFGGVKPRRVLEALALSRGGVVSHGRLIDVLWGEHPPPDHTATLQSYVSVLRRCIQPGVPPRRSAVRTVHGGYLLDPAAARTDLDLFDLLVARADTAPTRTALDLLDRASELASAELLTAADDAYWAEPVRVDYRGHAVRAALRGAELALGPEGGPEATQAAVRLTQRALGLDQYCEPAWRLLMRALGASGRRDAALRAYRDCRRRLADDLGVEPAPETQAALRQLVGERGGPARTPTWESGDLGSVLGAVFDLFEGGVPRRGGVNGVGGREAGARLRGVDHSVEVLIGLLRRFGVGQYPLAAGG